MSKRSGAEKRHPRVRTTPFLPIFASENTAIMAQRKIIHVDMDAFFASVEQRDNPAYRGRPIAVGYDGPRGVVATASYEARPYGVHSALPSAVARRLCPSLIFVPARFEVYKEVSQQIRAIFHRYTELVEPLSLDEAFLDVSHHRSATLVAREIKAAIRAETGLTASAGISVNKMLAKIASDYRKPDGLFTIAPAQVEEFVAALPVERFFGIGEVTAERMHRLGIRTGADLRHWSEEALVHHFGKAGHAYYGYARGIDEREVTPQPYPQVARGRDHLCRGYRRPRAARVRTCGGARRALGAAPAPRIRRPDRRAEAQVRRLPPDYPLADPRGGRGLGRGAARGLRGAACGHRPGRPPRPPHRADGGQFIRSMPGVRAALLRLRLRPAEAVGGPVPGPKGPSPPPAGTHEGPRRAKNRENVNVCCEFFLNLPVTKGF